MSRLSDYSKFDHLDSDSDDEKNNHKGAPSPAVGNGTTPQQQPMMSSSSSSSPSSNSSSSSQRRNPETNRFVFEYNGKAIYEWEQNLEEVILYIPLPFPNVNAKRDLVCSIEARHFRLALQNSQQYFLDEDTFGIVNVSESTWTVEGDSIVIYLAKSQKGLVWESALLGKKNSILDPLAQEQVKKDLMLERFQEENPGMDFRDAQFNGAVPDPRTFMGGVKYT